jgi:ribosomal protein L12E/L44/L45/RPP1/RPP2
MMNLIAAALVAAQPAAAPADAHAQHAQHQQTPPKSHEQHKQMAEMKDCCCKEMMDKMHSGRGKDGMQDHQEHGGR